MSVEQFSIYFKDKYNHMVRFRHNWRYLLFVGDGLGYQEGKNSITELSSKPRTTVDMDVHIPAHPAQLSAQRLCQLEKSSKTQSDLFYSS